MGERANRLVHGAGLLKRRGLLAGVAALAGMALGRLAGAGRAEAAHTGITTPGNPEPVHFGVINDLTGASNDERVPASTLRTTLTAGFAPGGTLRVLNNAGGLPTVGTRNDYSDGVQAYTVGIGPGTPVPSTGAGAAGVAGKHFTLNQGWEGFGVIGDSIAAPDSTTGGTGVVGTSYLSDATTFGRGIGVHGRAGNGVGVWGEALGITSIAAGKIGVLGLTTNGVGVQGQGRGSGTGVRGSSNAGGGEDFGGSGIGVEGRSGSGTGVLGQSTSSVGVQGVSTNNAGVYGVGPIGVFATGTGTAAVYGASNGTYGVWGNSGASAGVIGTSTSYIGVQALSTSHWGLHAKSPTYAGVFEGSVFVTGQVIALGGVVGVSGASAGARTAEASTLAEDVGEATLVNGKATVALSQGFAAEVKGGQYHVFVTPHDASVRGLAVVARRGDGFDVQELVGGTTEPGGAPGRGGNAGFSYRVVAKLAGPAGQRQAPPAPPDLTTVKPTPKPPEPPKAPEPSGAPEERRPR